MYTVVTPDTPPDTTRPYSTGTSGRRATTYYLERETTADYSDQLADNSPILQNST